jgi:hypothetical protein
MSEDLLGKRITDREDATNRTQSDKNPRSPMIVCPQLAAASCAFGLGKRRDCAFHPVLMCREPLSGGLFVEEFVEPDPRARRDSIAAAAPL